MFGSVPWNVIVSVLCQTTYDWGGEKGFGWRRKCRDWGTIASQVGYAIKALISKQTLRYFNTLDLTQPFE